MRVYQETEIEIPNDLNLTELLHTTATPDVRGDTVIASDNLTDRTLTLDQLRDRAGRIAHGLKRKLNPAEGDRWAIIVPNSVDYVEIFHALLWTGGVSCPINWALKASEIGRALSVSQPRFVFAYGKIISKVNEALAIAEKELQKKGIAFQRPQVLTVVERVAGYPHVPDDFFEATKLAIPHYKHTEDHVASIHLSSGTTGLPKGIQLTHYNYVSNVLQLYHHDPSQFNSQTRTVGFTPYVHIALTTLPLFLGPWTGMLHHAMPQYDLETFGKMVSRVKPTTFQGVPSVVLSFANTDITNRYDFSNARIINTGGAPFKEDMLDRLMSKAPWKTVQLYGMTEASPYVAYQKYDETVPKGATGKLLPNLQAVLKKPGTTEDAPEGGPGELWLKGPNIAKSYVFNPNATKEAFPMPGWFNTGDVCTIDANGYVAVVGRTKELIKYKGFQVSPIELEAHANSHPHVIECGIGSIWDESQLTELPTAYVVLKPHFKTIDEKRQALKDIHQAVDSQVSGYKKLRGGVWNISALPKNPTGKILRKELQGRTLGQCSLPERETARPAAKL
ncbi:AMP-binding enzyme [Xylona heveae TC161]|uniref:AMP-binding enzyme n=1 Tax=Xylona heveae (strain CBS 132557 / TC161) TaxID=1328760 RepID=A0A165GLJ1_XYLHT|nr:AMP-binding enzyme [Xylona heveae TC161]KZF22338.1 AMP-binding enzyme [Xylona heveae TC161]